MKELVKAIVTPLVDHPGEIDVKEVESENGSVLELRVNESDLGKVIGKQGRTAKAIRTIINAASVRSGKRISLEIMD
jgi:predicted RNA-binding protein YlqC (UPF0109 family)